MTMQAVTAGADTVRPFPTNLSPTGPMAPVTAISTPSCSAEIDALFNSPTRGSLPASIDVQPFDCTGPIGERQPGGWVLATETWTRPVEREAVLERYLAGSERIVYEQLNPRAQRTWLLGRIAAKDAVAHWHGERGRSVSPRTIVVANDAEGRPYLIRFHGAELSISIAHLPWVAVAIVAEGYDVGLDLEEVADRPDSFVRVAFSAGERQQRQEAIQAGVGAHTSVSDALWMAAAWCAKEAAGKARGTGLQGRPSAFATDFVEDGMFAVDDRHVRWTVLDPSRLRSVAGRALVVGWTLAPASPVVIDLDALDLRVGGGLDAALAAVLAAARPSPVGRRRRSQLVPADR